MAEKTEPIILGDVLKWEQDNMYSRENVTVKSGESLALCEVVGRITNATPTTGTADGGNSGDGTMTGVAAGDQVQIGTYTATCKVGGGSGAVTTPTTGTADGGNTGNGTMTAVTAGASAKAGTYQMTCTAVPTGAAVVPATGTAAGGNAGANTMGSVSGGAAVKIGTYNVVCTDATNAGAEVFQVTDPDGLLLAPATVGVAYVNDQILFTIADPGANAQVGDAFTIAVTEDDHDAGTFTVTTPDGAALPPATVGVAYTNAQINFTINDGVADFIVGDTFTVLATAADGDSGTFAITAPDGTALSDATVGVAYTNEQIAFTINDGAADYVAGDIFTVAVAAGSGQIVPVDASAVDGSQHAYGFMVGAVDATLAAKAGVAVVRDAIIVAADLVWPDGATNDQKTAWLADLAAVGIVARTAA